MSESIAGQIIDWSIKNNIKINNEIMGSAPEDDKYEFNYSLVEALKDVGSGYWRDSYEGMHPEGFLPDLIKGILSQVTDKSITLVSLSSNDSWETANITLQCEGNDTEIKIGNAGGEDPDYAPEEIYSAIEEYVKENCSNVLKGIFSEGGYIYLYMTQEQLDSFDKIMNGFPEPNY